MEEVVEKYLERAELALRDGFVLLDLPDGAFSAVSRFYYSVFYAKEAVFHSSNHHANSHKGAIVLCNQHFIKTGIFE